MQVVTYGGGFVPRVEHNDSDALVFMDHVPQSMIVCGSGI